jgi:hypothetical protein
MNVEEVADHWRYAVEVAEKEADRLRTLLENHKASHYARFGKYPLDLDLAQLCEDLPEQHPNEGSQPNEIESGTGKDSLELRKDTPSMVEVENAIPQSTAIQPSTPVEQSLLAQQLSPIESGPHIGPPTVRLPPQSSNGHTYLLSEPQEGSPLPTQEATTPGSTSTTQANQPSQKRARYRLLQKDMRRWDLAEQRETCAAQEAPTTQLNPAARSFEATQEAEVAQSILDRRLNPAAQAFETTIMQSILARQLNPAAQPFRATQSDPAAQSISVAQAAPAKPSTRAIQPISATWSRLAQEVEYLFTLTGYSPFRREPNELLKIKAYNEIHYGGPGPSAPKGELYCKGLFKREATRPQPPVVQQLFSPRIQALPCPQALIDDGFSLPPPALPMPSMPCEQTSAQPVTEGMLPERSVLVEGHWLVQQPNGRTPAEAVELAPGKLSCASAATREPRTSEGESSALVDERRAKRAVVRRLLALRSWRKE